MYVIDAPNAYCITVLSGSADAPNILTKAGFAAP
jgi:hypothetical protein